MKAPSSTFIKVLIAASFFIPLIVLPSTFIFPFIVPKIIAFRILTLLMLGGYILLCASHKEYYLFQKTPLTIALGVYFLVTTISTFVGVDWYRSLWDNHERMLGLFTLFHYGIYYLVVTSVLKEWNNTLRLFLFAGSLVVFLGFFQRLVPDFLLNNGSPRVSSTLGNAIYLSGYGLFLWHLALIQYQYEKTVMGKRIMMAVAFFGLAGIFLGGTRGTLIAFLVSLAVMGIIYLMTHKNNKRVRLSVAGAAIFLVGLFGLLYSYRTTSFVRALPAVGRLLNASFDVPRVMAWEIAIESWKQKPFFGWGPNNFFYAFNAHYNPDILRHGWGETWFDNAHNVLLNTLSTQGIVGLLSYLSLFAVAIVVIWKAYRAGRLSLPLCAVSIGFFIAHLIHNIFVFENPTSYLYFFFFLAFINAATLPSVAGRATTKRSISPVLGIAVWGCIIIAIYITNINTAKANTHTLNAIRGMRAGGEVAMKAFRQALSYNSPHVDDMRTDFIRASIPAIQQNKTTGGGMAAKNLFLYSYDLAKQNRDMRPLDIRMYIQMGDLEQLGAQLFNDKSYLVKAEETYIKSIELSPKRQQVLFNLAYVKFLLGKNQESLDILRSVVDSAPVIAESWWRLAYLYEQVGRHEEAVKTIEEARDKKVIFNAEEEKLLNSILNTTASK